MKAAQRIASTGDDLWTATSNVALSRRSLDAFVDWYLPVAEVAEMGRAGLSRDLGFGADVGRGEYRYLFSLQAGSLGFGSESVTRQVAVCVVS